MSLLKIIPARDPKKCGGVTGDETSGGDDDGDDTQMRAQRSRHMRAHESRHIRAHIWKHTYGCTQRKSDICEHTDESTRMKAQKGEHT